MQGMAELAEVSLSRSTEETHENEKRKRVKRYVGIPTAAAIPKQISWRFVRLNAIFVFILDKSLGTLT